MYIKIIVNIFLGALLLVAQIAFISSLPSWFNKLNLIIVVLVFILGFCDFKLTLWWSLGMGFVLDMLSFYPFGINLVSIAIIMLLANFLLENFFTNRSLYSYLALTAFFSVSYKVLSYSYVTIIYYIGKSNTGLIINKVFWQNELKYLLMNLLLTILIFYILSFVSINLKPAFLLKKSNYQALFDKKI